MRTLARTAVAAAMALTTGACGGGGEEAGGGSSPEAPAGAESTVAVELGVFFVTAEPASVPPGTVTFDVAVETSSDAPGHALTVLRTDLAPDALPTKSDGQALTVDERIEIMYSEGVTGSDHSADVELPAGSYVLICNIGNHYDRGMYTGFTVA